MTTTNALGRTLIFWLVSLAGALGAATAATSQELRPPGNSGLASGPCEELPAHADVTAALEAIVAPGQKAVNGGLGNHMWAAVVDRNGNVCTVTRSTGDLSKIWPASRAVALAKAYTANGFSLDGFALSTANLYWPAQPGSSLFGIAEANPIDPSAAYAGAPDAWGTVDDPAVGTTVGGSIAFGGGLALYDGEGILLGALGLSGDQSCTDHIIAWKLRDQLELDNVPDGVTPDHDDNIIHDITVEPGTKQKISRSGYGHPTCSPEGTRIAQELPDTHPTGRNE